MAVGDQRNIRVNVTVDSDTRGGDDAAKSLEGVDKSAAKAGESMRRMGVDAKGLNAEIAQSKQRIKELGDEFHRTRDSSSLIDLRRERSNLRELQRIAKEASESLSGAGSSASGSLKGPLIGGLVAVAAAAAPIIGAIISGAVAGTVAGGGIAGGIIAASNDSRVRSAFNDLTSEMTAEAFGGGAFVNPVIQGLHILRNEFDNLGIGDAFAKGASSVPILAQGIADMVANIMPGFNEVMDHAEDFTRVFGEGLSETGAALSDFLHSLMSSEGTIEGLAFGFKLLAGFIIAVGNTLEFLGNSFHTMLGWAVKFNGFMADITDKIPVVGASFRFFTDKLKETEAVGWSTAKAVGGTVDVIRDAAKASDEAAEAQRRLNDEFERNITLQGQMILDNLSVEEGLQNLADTLAQNGTTMDSLTDSGRENQRALINVAREMRQVRDDTIAMGGSTADANATLQANYERLIAQAEAAGIARAEIEKLIGALFKVPVVYADIISNRTITANTVEGRRAAGGSVDAYGTYLVGEQGPELLRMGSQGGYVVPNHAIASGAGGGGSAWAAPVSVSGGGLGQLVFEWLREEIRARGGELAVLGLKAPA